MADSTIYLCADCGARQETAEEWAAHQTEHAHADNPSSVKSEIGIALLNYVRDPASDEPAYLQIAGHVERYLAAAGFHLVREGEVPPWMEQCGWTSTKGFTGHSEPGQHFLHGHFPDHPGPGHEDCEPLYRMKDR